MKLPFLFNQLFLSPPLLLLENEVDGQGFLLKEITEMVKPTPGESLLSGETSLVA